jgi:DNA-binding MarR family transcriptional regulator
VSERSINGLATGSTSSAVHPAGELGQAFKSATSAVRRLRSRESRRVGELRDAQYSLLFGLREHSELPSSELAHLAAVSPAGATELLDQLVKEGLVSRTRSERDRRVVLVSLTQRGEALVEERRAFFEPRWNAAFAEFSEDELQTAARVLDRIARLFDELAEE